MPRHSVKVLEVSKESTDFIFTGIKNGKFKSILISVN